MKLPLQKWIAITTDNAVADDHEIEEDFGALIFKIPTA